MKLIYKKSNEENPKEFIEALKNMFDRIRNLKKQKIRKLIKNTNKYFKY